MCSTTHSGLASGNSGSSQTSLDNQELSSNKVSNKPPTYEPSKKHEENGWGSKNPIKSQSEGQKLLDTSIKHKKTKIQCNK